MMLYLFKTILCSVSLLMGYKLLLANVKMHKFSRFYLLFSILFSLIAPLITIKVNQAEAVMITQPVIEEMSRTQDSSVLSRFIVQENDSSFPIIYFIIFIPGAILLIRFTYNLYLLNGQIKQNKVIAFLDSKLVLTKEKGVPYSFLNYIFVNRHDYENGLIPQEIFHHELAHVRQRHSIDILIFEIIHVAFWFNPVLFFYRNAMRLNHEFLADDAVISRFSDIAAYQYLLVTKTNGRTVRFPVTSPFNFLTTKKRLLMMTKHTSRKQKILRQSATVFFLAGAVLLFGNYIQAQREQQKVGDTVSIYRDKGISSQLFNEYETALKNAEIATPDFHGKKITGYTIDKLDRHRMDFLYYSMSPEQKRKATNVGFIPTPLPPQMQSPTAEQLFTWSKSGQYRIWKDGERLSRLDLGKHKPTDFIYFKVSAVSPNSIDYKQFSYYVDVMTAAYFNACYVAKTTWNLRIGRGEQQYLQ